MKDTEKNVKEEKPKGSIYRVLVAVEVDTEKAGVEGMTSDQIKMLIQTRIDEALFLGGFVQASATMSEGHFHGEKI